MRFSLLIYLCKLLTEGLAGKSAGKSSLKI